MERSRPAPWGWALVAAGLGLAATHAGHVLGAASVDTVMGSGVSLVAALGVTVLAVRLSADPDRVRVVCRGVGIGVGVMAAVFVLAVVATPGTTVPAADLPRMAADLLTAGAVVGTLLGLYDARSRREHRRAEALFANLPVPTAYVERDGGDRIVRATNDAFRDAFGPAGSHAGRPLADCVPDPADGRSPSAAVADGPRGRFRCAATASHPAREFVVTPVDAGVPDHEYVTLADVTEDRRRERRLSVLNRVLRHDLRSGLAVVLGHAELLADDPDDPAEHLRTIRRRVDSLVGTSDRARVLDRRLAGTVTVRTVDLAAVVADRLDARGPDRGPAVGRSLPARPVVVRDDGLVGAVFDGVRETDLDHASGLGLWFVRWVVTELGGDVTVTTGDGSDGAGAPTGTTVVVRLPLAVAADASAPASRRA